MKPFSHFHEILFTLVVPKLYWPRYVVIDWSIFSLKVIVVVVRKSKEKYTLKSKWRLNFDTFIMGRTV